MHKSRNCHCEGVPSSLTLIRTGSDDRSNLISLIAFGRDCFAEFTLSEAKGLNGGCRPNAHRGVLHPDVMIRCYTDNCNPHIYKESGVKNTPDSGFDATNSSLLASPTLLATAPNRDSSVHGEIRRSFRMTMCAAFVDYAKVSLARGRRAQASGGFLTPRRFAPPPLSGGQQLDGYPPT